MPLVIVAMILKYILSYLILSYKWDFSVILKTLWIFIYSSTIFISADVPSKVAAAVQHEDHRGDPAVPGRPVQAGGGGGPLQPLLDDEGRVPPPLQI